MDFQLVVSEITGSSAVQQPAKVDAKPHWLARRAAYLRLNAIHSGAVQGLHRRRATHRRGKGLLGLRRGDPRPPRG